MKTGLVRRKWGVSLSPFPKVFLWVGLLLALGGTSGPAAPVFSNAGFEDNGPAYNTSYNSFKTPIASWTASGAAGVMYTNGTGDAFTSGTGYQSQMAGMRQLGGITQTVSGFTVGSNYVVVWQGNGRESISLLEIVANGRYLWSDAVKKNASGFLSYTSRPFTATSASLVLSFRAPNSADMTTLLDNLQLLLTTNAVISPCVDLWPMSGSAVLGYASDPYGIAPYEGAAYIRCQGAVNATLTIRELQAGNSYRASFYARNRAAGSPNDFRVSVDGTVRLGGSGYTVAGTAWTNLEFDFSATGATAALKFESLFTLGGDRTVCFDGFSVRANPGLPVTVTALGVTDIGTNQATLRGSLDGVGSAENPYVTFCWGKTDGGTTDTGAWTFASMVGTNWGIGQEFSTNVTGLLSGTGYYYRCFASNSAGTDWSDTAPCFTTRMLAAVSNLGTISVDTVWAILKGQILSTGGDTPSIWLYSWPAGGAVTSIVALGLQTNLFEVELPGLASNTTYEYAYLASNLAGVAWSETRAFTTPGWPTFLNPRFEDNGPGYNATINTFKAPVTNWTILGAGGLVGVMTTNSADAYVGGKGARSQVLGICGALSASFRGVSQTVSGFTPGQRYVVAWEGNSRPTFNASVILSVAADGRVIWSDALSFISGQFLSYTSRPFTAASTNVTLSFYLPYTNADQTALLDNLRIVGTTNAVSPFVDLNTTVTGTGIYNQYPDGYNVPPYEGYHQLRIQQVGSGTMTIRELRGNRRYLVSYYVANRTAPPNANDFRVLVDGLVKTGGPNFTVSGAGIWTNQVIGFTATGATASLTFEALNTPGGDRTVFFDGFSVDALPLSYGTIFYLN